MQVAKRAEERSKNGQSQFAGKQRILFEKARRLER
jgi:hypothetical protein